MTGRDWLDWHGAYDDAGSTLSRRLVAVQDRIRAALDECRAGPLRLISLCAGQGRDLLGVLPSHPRRDDVTARLVELDPRNVAAAQQAVDAAGLGHRVEIRVGDAALLDQYADLAPAEVVLACGVFGNISDEDIERTIVHCAQLCASGGFVVWTRHRRAPDFVPTICQQFEGHGFERRWLSDPGDGFGVGVHRLVGRPQPLAVGAKMFTFRPLRLGRRVLPRCGAELGVLA